MAKVTLEVTVDLLNNDWRNAHGGKAKMDNVEADYDACNFLESDKMQKAIKAAIRANLPVAAQIFIRCTDRSRYAP